MTTFHKFLPALSSAVLLACIGITAHAETTSEQKAAIENSCIKEAKDSGINNPDEIQEFVRDCVRAQTEEENNKDEKEKS